MFALINGITLHYRLDGASNGAPLVFINSLGCDLRIWEPVVAHWMGDYRMIFYDKRGHGLSDAPPGPYTIHDHTQDLEALLADLKVSSPVLLGISVGGLVAMDYALLHPDGVRALVLCDTAPKIGTAEGWNERIEKVNELGLENLAEVILSRWFMPSFSSVHPAEYRGYINMLSRSPQAGYTATCSALRDADLRESISAIQVPVLAICGSGDGVVTPEQTREWAACLPRARVDIINDAAHLPCIEQPEAVATAIKQFLKEEFYG